VTRMTVAEAKAAGLLDGTTATGRPKKKRTTQKSSPRNKSVTVCVQCGERFTTDAAETRHVDSTGHPRYVAAGDTQDPQTQTERETDDGRTDDPTSADRSPGS
jgi:hypothetical protein